MALLVDDCPRCSAKRITFDVLADVIVNQMTGEWEAFSVCRNCKRTTVFHLRLRGPGNQPPSQLESVNGHMVVVDYVSVADRSGRPAPEHLPSNIKAAFDEGAKCLAVGCNNAAGGMFRLTLELSTKDAVDALTDDERKELGKQNGLLATRLAWLFKKGKLSESLRGLSSVVKDDGNAGVHDGTLDRESAESLADFAERLLTQRYTEPKEVEIALERAKERKKGKNRGRKQPS